MAQASNKRCGRYFSRCPDHEAEGRNFFSQKLVSTTTYYCFPPPSLIPASLLHFLKFEAHGMFLVPVWSSCSFWSLLVPDGVHPTRGVKAFLRFWPSGFVMEEGVRSGTFKGEVTFDMLGLEFNFTGLGEVDLGVSLVVKDNCLSYGCDHCQ